MEQLVESRERELRLRFGADRRKDASASGPDALSGVLEQRRLTDSSLAADDQYAAATGKAIGELVQELQLGISSDQVSNCLRPSR